MSTDATASGGVDADLFGAAREAAYPAMPRPVHTTAEIRGWFDALLTPAPSAEATGGPTPEPPGAPGRETWVAEHQSADGEPVGYLVLDAGWLDSLYVRPGLTGRGIGAALLDLAKSLRPGGFALWVFETNAGARRFYARHGLWELEHTDGSTNEERAPDVRMAWPGRDPVAYLRAQIDEVDDELAHALARRAALTAAIQAHKEVPGRRGRDPAREAEIVARMARQVPALGRPGLAAIMDAVITTSLDATERDAE
jgi:chorismate mutase/GNAT superfamily N-acetyltransferase